MPNTATDIYFWSGIMRDHAEFQILALSSREMQYVMMSQRFKNLFIQIEKEAEQLMKNANKQEETALVIKTTQLLNEYISYKQMLLRKLLECDIELGLPPTFVNHMINEALEFLRTLAKAQNQSNLLNKAQENIFLHTIWLPDAAGHAASIVSDLDPTEAILINEGEEFKKIFNNLFIKAFELEKMIPRASIDNGTLAYINEEVIENMNKFINYLEKIKILRQNCKAMGAIKPLVPDHMIREEKYYINKITELIK
ncbi:MAG: DUF2935 domain-containing protein [Clostridia bacterium]|nr:DUF2935 domain-containing protein [Clostridia bacterium]